MLVDRWGRERVNGAEFDMNHMARRRFFQMTGRVVSPACLGCLLSHQRTAPLSASPGDPALAPLTKYRRSGRALGAAVSITVLHPDRPTALDALDAAFTELNQVDRLLSIYRTDSQVCRLNRNGFLDAPHPCLLEALRVARRVAQQTGGAFDVTVQPLWKVYERAKREKRLPTDDEIRAARARVDWRRVHIAEHRIELRGEGTAITLNGLAQGYALDRVRAVLRRKAIHHALVDTGELGAIGQNAHGKPWRVGIQHPRQANAFVAVVQLDERCLATSGDYATTFTADRTANHLFEPSTGRSPHELSSVSIVAPKGVLADALATAVTVMGSQRGLQLIHNLPAVDGLLVSKTGEVHETNGFPRVG